MHYHYRSRNVHLDFMHRARFNVVKMFTPPKSKSPWEAMTAGSTGGWAAPLEKLGWLGPTLMGAAAPFTGGLSLLGAAGMGMAGMAGKGTGFQGTDKGWGNLGSTLMGGLAGAGLGALGAGASGALSGAMNAGGGSLLGGAIKGFGTGVQNYMSPVTNLIGKLGATKGIVTAKPASSSFAQSLANPYGQNWGVPSISSGMNANANLGLSGSGSSLLNPINYGGYAEAATGAAGGNNWLGGVLQSLVPTGDPSQFNLGNVASLVMGGQNALGAWNGMTQAPQLQRNREEALGYINTPDLVAARGMIKDLAMKSPSEILSPAGDEFVAATLRQHREAVDKQNRLALDTYGARGQVAGKSGAVDKYLRESAKNALQQESDYIAQINESRMLAATKMKIDAVQQYYNVSAAQAAEMLAAEGYINPIDAQNYMAAMQEYQTAQQLAGYMQLAPMLGGR